MSGLLETHVDFAPGLERAFFGDIEEQSCEISEIEGEIPDFVRGSYFLNGPAKFHFADGLRYRHWLDGDGMVCALHFRDDGIFFDSKYVHGRKFFKERSERDTDKPIYRAFGTAFAGDRLKRGIGTESPYNVSVFPYHDKLLAFGEQSLPMQLDPVSLETLTPGKTYDFDGALNDASPFSAHPKINERGELLNFGIFFAPDQPLLIYYRFDEAGELACRTRIPIDTTCSMHDFAACENYVVFYLSPYTLDTEALVGRGMSTIDSLRWDPDRGSQLLVLCRDTGEEIARVSVDGRYCLHTINAFEADGHLVVDLIEFERPVYDQYQVLPDLFEDVPYGQPVRFELDLATQSVARKSSIDYRNAPDFPTIDPRADSRPYDDFWMVGMSAAGRPGRKFFNQLVHAKWSQVDDVDLWQSPRGHYLGGEPVFVGNPTDEDEGVIICHLFDASESRSHFAIFNAENVSLGPIATIPLQQPIHLGFHATFSSRTNQQ